MHKYIYWKTIVWILSISIYILFYSTLFCSTPLYSISLYYIPLFYSTLFYIFIQDLSILEGVHKDEPLILVIQNIHYCQPMVLTHQQPVVKWTAHWSAGCCWLCDIGGGGGLGGRRNISEGQWSLCKQWWSHLRGYDHVRACSMASMNSLRGCWSSKWMGSLS